MAKDTEVRIDLEYDMNHGREFWYASIRNNCERLLTAYPGKDKGAALRLLAERWAVLKQAVDEAIKQARDE